MDVKQKPLFYRTAYLICCLFSVLLLQTAYAAADHTESASLTHPRGLLWQIKKDGEIAGYLFGTIHIGDNRVLRLIDRVQEPLKQSQVFAMEVVLDRLANQAIANASFFPEEERLQDYLDDVLLDRINRIMTQYYGILPNTVNRMRPWAVMATISSPPPESNRAVLDVELQNLAEQESREVVGLETVAEQIDTLSGMNMSEQLWMLNKAVDDFEKTMGMWDELINNYLQRNLQALMQEQDALMDASSTIDDRFMDRLLTQRNIKMAKRLDDIMQKKTVFAAIGALHLPGKQGVLSLLEKQGYSVSVIY